MTNIVVFHKPTHASISPAVKGAAIAWLLAEKDATERRLARHRADLDEITGRKEN